MAVWTKRSEVRIKLSGIKKKLKITHRFLCSPKYAIRWTWLFHFVVNVFFCRGQLRIIHTSYATLSSGVIILRARVGGYEHLLDGH